jgi:hypothetical protein
VSENAKSQVNLIALATRALEDKRKEGRVPRVVAIQPHTADLVAWRVSACAGAYSRSMFDDAQGEIFKMMSADRCSLP